MLSKLKILFLSFNNLEEVALPPSLEQIAVFKTFSSGIEKLPDFSAF